MLRLPELSISLPEDIQICPLTFNVAPAETTMSYRSCSTNTSPTGTVPVFPDGMVHRYIPAVQVPFRQLSQ